MTGLRKVNQDSIELMVYLKAMFGLLDAYNSVHQSITYLSMDVVYDAGLYIPSDICEECTDKYFDDMFEDIFKYLGERNYNLFERLIDCINNLIIEDDGKWELSIDSQRMARLLESEF